MGTTFGGDAENFMEAPRMENKGLAETIAGVAGGGSGNPIAMLLDLVGLHRQAAKGPKEDPAAVEAPQAVVPKVLTDVESALKPSETPLTPVADNAPMTTWGQRWIESIKPLTKIDPNG